MSYIRENAPVIQDLSAKKCCFIKPDPTHFVLSTIFFSIAGNSPENPSLLHGFTGRVAKKTLISYNAKTFR